MYPAIALKLEVEAMRYQVQHAFMSHSKEVEEQIGLALDKALKDFDFIAVVKEEAGRIITKAVKDAIASASSDLMWQEPIRDMIQAGASRKVREAIEQILSEHGR